MSNDTETLDAVVTSASALSRENSRKELATRTHYALIGYFGGDDPTGPIRSQTSAFLGAVIAVLRGEDTESARAYSAESKAELRATLSEAFESAGFEAPDSDGDGPTRPDTSVRSVGPILPVVLAYLRTVEGYEATDGDGFEDTSLGGS